ncbi:hypothetical protein HW555_005158 [Spodoptera exigua]|uniref:Uncharacterized protein n=1 Tax=Spodoptera exigua TaxID=7107 RepID=A0A835GHM3_SPOEX|nr:hypothetical protein HW555_005158 [Spodoptera exigua]
MEELYAVSQCLKLDVADTISGTSRQGSCFRKFQPRPPKLAVLCTQPVVIILYLASAAVLGSYTVNHAAPVRASPLDF